MDFNNSSVGVVIVNYNAGVHLTNAVQSARTQNVGEIIVIDNGSKDDSLNRLQLKFPTTKVIRQQNYGFGMATNRGVSQLSEQIEFVLALNPDAVLQPDAVKSMLEPFSDTAIAMVGPKIVDEDNVVYPSARRFPSVTDSFGHGILGRVWPDNPFSKKYKQIEVAFTDVTKVDWISGSSMMIRKSEFEKVGGFDESYFMYFEDVDLCKRLRKTGCEIVIAPHATVLHVGGVSTKRLKNKMMIAHHRSAVRYFAKHLVGAKKALAPLFALGLGIRLIVGLAYNKAIDIKGRLFSR